MAKKVVNIVKNNKKDKNVNISKKNNEIFNLNEEIIIGINNKKSPTNSSKSGNKKNSKNNSKKTNTSNKAKQTNKNNQRSSTKKTSQRKTTNQKIKKNNIENIDNKNLVPKKSNKILKILLLVILLIVAGIALLASPLFYVQTIVVENNKNVSQEEIITLSGIQLNQNIFKYVNFNVIDKIKEHSYIENIEISRKYPSTIIIDVEEREMTYYIKLGESFVYIDNQGYIIDILGEDLNLPEIIGFQTEPSNFIKGRRLVETDLSKLEKIITIFDYAKTNGINEVIESFTIDEKRIIIGLQGGKIAYIGNFNNLNIKMLSLKTIIERTDGKSGEIFLDGQGQSQSIVFKEKI